MKKTIFTIAIAIAAVCGLPAAAQSTSTQQCTNQQQCTQNTDCAKKNKGQRPDPFAGITLTEQQKTALDALKPAKCEQGKCSNDSAKAERKAQARNDRRQSRRDYINGVKNVLTPEQYVVFLENIVVEGPAQPGPRMLKGGQAKMQRLEGRGFDKNKKAKGTRALDKAEAKAKVTTNK